MWIFGIETHKKHLLGILGWVDFFWTKIRLLTQCVSMIAIRFESSHF